MGNINVKLLVRWPIGFCTAIPNNQIEVRNAQFPYSGMAIAQTTLWLLRIFSEKAWG
jgi:hypothetical protein